ncbi:hypothetical protein HDV05_003192 [Chytridiales sp. JEL 0842]|nr:hypothetical protein HDV05_003192 [Chytridiales sp. JEL 0842]
MELETQKAKVVGCVANYVRSTVLSSDVNADLLYQSIAEGKPYTTTSFAVVSMIDISGYSSLTSSLTSLGKLSSELITNTVGSYMDQVVTCISTFGGDVIKFLGDAILICFSMKSDESETELAERATYCCLYVSTFLKSFSINLGKAMQDYQKHTDRKIKDASGVPSFVSNDMDAMQTEVTLEIHVALTCGDVTHVIMGLHEKRYDYTIHGPCMQDLGVLLDGTKRGELGISERVMSTLNKPVRKIIHQFCSDSSDSLVIVRTPENMLALCDYFGNLPGCKPLKDSMENGVTQPKIEIKEAAYGLLRLFVSEALLYKLEKSSEMQRFASVKHRRKTISRASYASVSPTDITAAISEQRDAQKGNIHAEFRVVSVIFVKLKSSFTPEKAQTVFQKFVEVLRKWEGTFQQFSVDDKGQTMLACFGLPPWTHERDALYALKAAVEFEQACKDLKTVGEISISVATGDLLFSKLGNDARSDASLLGDTVNVAARLLGLGNTFEGHDEPLVVRCDAVTYALTKEDFAHISLGLKKVKGKSKAIEVFAVKSKDDLKNIVAISPNVQGLEKTTFGYKKERQILESALHAWLGDEGGQRVVVQGKSGTGKSKLLDFIAQRATETGVQYCLSQGSEIKQFNSYSGIQALMTYIYKKYADLPADSDPKLGAFSSAGSKATLKLSESTLNRAQSYYSSGTNRASRGASRSQLLQFVREDGNGGDQHTKAIMKFLKDMGENPLLAPLIAEVLSFVSISDNPFTKRLDAPTRKNLLKSIIIRIVNKSISMDRFVFILDDAQWMDPVSLEILLEIITKCPNLMLYIFMRPLPDDALPIFQQIFQAPSLQRLEINGLTQLDVNEMLLYKFAEFGIKDISPRVSKVIFEKSDKSPLVIDSICEAVQTDFFDIFHISETKTLEFKARGGEEKLDNYTRVDLAVMQQFDKMTPQFQIILRGASIFGQYFDLADLACCLPFDATPEELSQIIQSQDKYQYLVKQDSGPYAYYFRHIQIMTAIYDSQSFSERADNHLDAAEYFEEMLNEANREHVLPLLAYHYKKTDVQFVHKQVQYLEELAFMRYMKSHYLESMNALEGLLAIAKTASSGIIDKHKSAAWISIYANCRVSSTNFSQNEVELALQALKQIDRPFSKDINNAKGEMMGALWNLFKIWRKTKGGTRPLRKVSWFSRQRVEPDNAPFLQMPEIERTEYTAYQALYQITAYTEILPKDAAGLLYIKLLTFCVIHGYRDEVRFAGVLYQLSFGFIWAVPALGKFLFNHGDKLERAMNATKDEEKIKAMEEWHLFKGLNLINFGRIEEALVCFENFLRFFEEREHMMWMAMVKFQMMEIYSFQADFTALDQSIVESVKNQGNAQSGIFFMLSVRRLVTNDIETAKSLVALGIESVPNSLRDKERENTIIIGSETLEAWFRYLEGNIPAMLTHLTQLSKPFVNLRLPAGSPQGENFIQIPLQFLVMYVGQNEKGDRYRWTEPEVAQMKQVLHIFSNACDHLSKKLDLALFYWTSILLNSMQLLLENKPAKAISLLTSSLRRKEKKLLDQLVAVRATVYTYLGLLLPSHTERLKYYNDALDLYRSRGHVLATRWLQSIDVMAKPVDGSW